MAGGYTGVMPPEFESWPIVDAMYAGVYLPDAENQLKAFLANHDVSAVIVSDNEKDAWRPLLSTLGVHTCLGRRRDTLQNSASQPCRLIKVRLRLIWNDRPIQLASTLSSSPPTSISKRTGSLDGLTPHVADSLG